VPLGSKPLVISLMIIISNYTINFIGYPSKYHSPEIEGATMGSRLTRLAAKVPSGSLVLPR
jgi:hypothetical protein